MPGITEAASAVRGKILFKRQHLQALKQYNKRGLTLIALTVLIPLLCL